jgi:membrane protease YdiL (CAAX protease family)
MSDSLRVGPSCKNHSCGTGRDVDRPQAEDRQLSREYSVPCSNRVAGWALLAGFALGIGCSLAKGMLLGSSDQIKGMAYLAAFIVTAGLAGPLAEEVYFRGILFVALADRLEKSRV